MSFRCAMSLMRVSGVDCVYSALKEGSLHHLKTLNVHLRIEFKVPDASQRGGLCILCAEGSLQHLETANVQVCIE